MILEKINNKRNSISINDTLILKGVTIILMICNHLYPIKEWIFPENQYISLVIGNKTFASYVGGFGKICVAVYAFLSGIGLFLFLNSSNKKNSNVTDIFKYGINKIFQLFLTYWGILFLFYIPLMKIFGVYDIELVELIKNIFVIDTSIIKVAWYVRFYAELMITLPILWKMLKDNTIFNDIILIIIVLVIHYYSYTFSLAYIYEYFNYLLVVLIGYFFEKYNVFKYMYKYISNCYISVICIFIIALLRGLTKNIILINLDMLYAPIYAVSICILVDMCTEKIRKIFLILGKYSTELWFLHAIYFIGSPYIQKIGYWPKFAPLILLCVLLELIPIAMLYNKIISCFSKNTKKIISNITKK